MPVSDQEWRDFVKDTREKNDAQLVILTQLKASADHMNGSVERLNKTVFGNGEPGMKVQMALLLQKESARKWVERTLYACIIASLVSATLVGIYKFIKAFG